MLLIDLKFGDDDLDLTDLLVDLCEANEMFVIGGGNENRYFIYRENEDVDEEDVEYITDSLRAVDMLDFSAEIKQEDDI